MALRSKVHFAPSPFLILKFMKNKIVVDFLHFYYKKLSLKKIENIHILSVLSLSIFHTKLNKYV